jgi:hypothetical protein
MINAKRIYRIWQETCKYLQSAYKKNTRAMTTERNQSKRPTQKALTKQFVKIWGGPKHDEWFASVVKDLKLQFMGSICVQKSRKLSNWSSASGLGRHSCHLSHSPLPYLQLEEGQIDFTVPSVASCVNVLQGGAPAIINAILASMQNCSSSLGFLCTSHLINLSRWSLVFCFDSTIRLAACCSTIHG